MLIYNSKEMPTQYMFKDNMVVEIHSILSPEELLTRLRAGEEVSPDVASVTAFSTNGGEVITQAEFSPTGDAETGHIGYDTILDEDDLEEYEEEAEERDSERPQILQAFEAYQFNRPWRTFPFETTEITKEMLMTQLYAALGIMPTIKDIPEKNITELKRMSSSGDRLYWGFTDVSHSNRLPNRADIEFYDSLSDYEKRIINESGVHPMKLLDIARGIKEGDAGRFFTSEIEQLAHRISNNDAVINIAKNPGLCTISNHRFSNAESPQMTALYSWMISEGITDASHASSFFDVLVTESERVFANEESRNLADIRQEYNARLVAGQTNNLEDWKKECEFQHFAMAMFEGFVFPQELLDRFAQNKDTEQFCRALHAHYREVFENEFLPQHTPENSLEANYDETMVSDFVKSAYKTPMPKVLQKSEEIFKELYRGHAPRVLAEYMYGQFAAKRISPKTATEQQIREIAAAFDQKNVSKVAKHKNLVLFALADKLNFNEVKAEHLNAFAIFIHTKNLHTLFQKGFVEWYKEHKDTALSQLVELLEIQDRIEQFDINKSARDLVADVTQSEGRRDCQLMEQRYGYRFSNNEIAIRGRHVVAQEGKTKMYMLSKDDYRNFTVGYDTHCCQHYDNAGESCVYKLTSDPFSACVVIERDGNILAQGFVWVDEAQDTLVFDNVEFADDRKVGQFNSLFAAWSRSMPYKNIHVGTGYNQGMHAWGKKVTYQAKMPTTLDDRRIYTDYHNDARSLKYNGAMQIQERTPVKVTKKDDEPTRWDILARPETSFLLNDFGSSIESRMEFARNFLNEQTPEIQLEAVHRNPFAIKYIVNPTEEVQRFVVARNPQMATMIQNPCVAVQKILIDSDPAYIRNIQNPDEDMARKAVQQNGLLLGDIENPSPVVIRMAVEQNGYAIRFVPEQTEDIQLAAVRNNPKVVSLLRNPSEDVQKAAINADPSVVSLITHPSEAVQIFAVERNPSVINDIPTPDYNAVKRAIEKNGLMIRNFQFTYPHLRMTALAQNGFAIRALKDPTDEEYVAAVRQNRQVANIIRDPEFKASVLQAAYAPQRPVEELEIEFE